MIKRFFDGRVLTLGEEMLRAKFNFKDSATA
jgi:hypothetical protein